MARERACGTHVSMYRIHLVVRTKQKWDRPDGLSAAKRPARRPVLLRKNDLGDELDRTRIAREVVRPMLKGRIVRLQEDARSGLAGKLHRVDQPRGVLRVVEEVAEVCPELKVFGLAEVKLLAERN